MRFRAVSNLLGALGALLILGACTAEPIHIGIALPLTGSKAPQGTNILAALNLEVDRINQAGGLKGRPIELVVKDDRNDVETARAVSVELGQDPRVVAVIGHYDAATAQAGAENYDRSGVVVYSPSVASSKFLSPSPWTFSGTYTDEAQARNMAVYAWNVFGSTRVLGIHADGIYGSASAKAFESKASRIGMHVDLLPFDEKAENPAPDLVRQGLPAGHLYDLVVIFSHADKGIPVIQALREAGYRGRIFAGDRVSSDVIQKLDVKYKPGLFFSFPFHYDLADFQAVDFLDHYEDRHKIEPSIWSGFAVDGLNLILDAIRRNGTERTSIRDTLASFGTPEKSFHGKTGRLYFDRDGAVVRSSTVVRMSTPGDMFKPVHDQLKVVSDAHNLRQVDHKTKIGEFILADGVPYFKIQVVYVGLDYVRVNNIDPREQSFNLDFYLWYRWTGDLNLDDLILTNAVGEVSKEPMREDLERPDRWQSYKVRASFRHPFDLRKFPFDVQALPITVAHRNRNADKLVLVADRERMRDYRIDQIYPEEYVYQHRKVAGGVFEIDSVFGNPTYRIGERQAPFSQFHSHLSVSRNIVPYLVTLFFPLTVILVIALFSFLIGKEYFQARLNLFMTALLTVVVFQMAQGAKMPRLGYAVMVDYYFMTSYAILFLFILKTLCVNWMHGRGRGSIKVDRLDRFFDAVFISSSVVLYGAITYIGLSA
jgi:branched-chain amino acid transport system substrate-binding protein